MAPRRGDELMRVKTLSTRSDFTEQATRSRSLKLTGSRVMHIPHELQEEFSAQAPLIERLKRTSHDFGRLAESYEKVNRNIHRIESEAEPADDSVIEEFKKQRLRLKDEIASILARLERRM
jgi:uncharacterized protein